MAFLGGLALLGSSGENYQKFKGRQQALDDADIDQAASVALGRGMQGLAQLGSGPTPPGGPAGDRTPDACWKWGMFYINPNDPALFVEKRFGIGYTVNLGNRWSWIFLVITLLPLILVKFYLR